MTTQIEKTLNLRPMDEIEQESRELTVEEVSTLLANSENLPAVPDDDMGLSDHVKEMDRVMDIGFEAHEKVFDLALNTAPAIAGPIFEQSSKFLDTVMTASKHKFEAKARMAKTMMEREKLDMEREKLDEQLGKYKTEGVVVQDSPTSFVGTRMDVLQKKIAEAKAAREGN